MNPLKALPAEERHAFEEIAERIVLDDYEHARGRDVPTTLVFGYQNGDRIEIPCDPPLRVRVEPSDPEWDLLRWSDGFLDPYWNISLLEPIPAFLGLTCSEMDGPSYQVVAVEPTGEPDETLWASFLAELATC